MEIAGTTEICGIIGSPVQHSMSPSMHNAAFNKCGLDFAYIAFEVKPNELGNAISGLRALNVKGFNVTIPHKEAIIKYLDELEPSATDIGAVNTVIRHKSSLIGANTDGEGVLRALKEHKIDIIGSNIVILGAGGAARAVCYSVSKLCETITILNRNENRAIQLSNELQQKDINARGLVLRQSELKKSLKNADLLVNATSVGMHPLTEESLLPIDLLSSELIIFDLVYNPLETKLLKLATQKGLHTINGVEMLVHQGAIAFEKWTGEIAPIDIMRQTIIKKLQGD